MTVRFVALAALCLNLVACFSGFKTSDIKCRTQSQCPKGYTCSIPASSEYGSCVSGTGATGGTGGTKASSSSLSSSSPTGGKGGGAGTGSLGGTGGQTSAIGGAGGSLTSAIGGASGSLTSAIGGASGGTATILGGATISAGGTTGGAVTTGSDVGGSSTTGGATGGNTTSPGGITAVTGGSGGNSNTSVALLDNGAVCKAGSECVSNQCIEGVCCDGKCDGQCESCKQTGSVGTCKALKGSPISGKTACAGTGTCKGECDGTNGKACAYPGATGICTAASCKDGKATAASVCDGQGACTTPATNTCPSNLCSGDGSKCSDSCTGGNCGADMYCSSTGVCLAKKKAGEKCTSKDECASDFCADGVCCSAACTGQCQACNETGKVGTCTRVAGAPRGTRTPCTSTVATCGGSCDGSSDTKCAYPGSDKVCTAAKCSTDLTTATPASVCNEAGACTSVQSIACGASGSFCASGACTTKLPSGGSCTNNIQCASDNCSNNKCCAAGLTWCGSSCVDLQKDNNHCGACNKGCGSQQCMSGLCCDSTAVKCGNVCCGPNHKCTNNVCSCSGSTLSCGQCGSWGFDSGTTEGWSDPYPGSSGITSMIVNNAHVYAGKYSLAVAFTTSADIEVKPCPTGIPLANYDISAKVLLVGNGLPSSGCLVHTYTNIMEYDSVEILGESWYDAPLLVPPSPMGDPAWTSPYIGLSVYCPGFTGTMYVDSVSMVK